MAENTPLRNGDEDCAVQLAKAPKDQILTTQVVQVGVFGQCCNVDVPGRNLMSLSLLQDSVQAQLGMKSLTFQIQNVDGVVLVTDEGLRESIMQGRVPLQASLDDSAIHNMESKRDEIAQMQWRMVREQFSSMNTKIHALTVELRELKGEVDQNQIGMKSLESSLQNQIVCALSKEAHKHDDAACATTNRIGQLAQAIHQEQAAREMLSSQQKAQMETARDILDTMKREWAMESDGLRREVMAVQEKLNVAERRFGEMTTQQAADKSAIGLRCDTIAQDLHEEVQQREFMISKASQEAVKSHQMLEKQVQRVQSNVHTVKAELTSEADDLEKRCGEHYKHFVDSLERKEHSMLQMVQRMDGLVQDFKKVRVERKELDNALQEISEKANESHVRLPEQIQRVEDLCQQLHEKEEQARQGQYKSILQDVSVCNSEIEAIRNVLNASLMREVSADGPEEMEAGDQPAEQQHYSRWRSRIVRNPNRSSSNEPRIKEIDPSTRSATPAGGSSLVSPQTSGMSWNWCPSEGSTGGAGSPQSVNFGMISSRSQSMTRSRSSTEVAFVQPAVGVPTQPFRPRGSMGLAQPHMRGSLAGGLGFMPRDGTASVPAPMMSFR